MTNYDVNFLPDLIEASQALNAEQKEYLINHLGEMPEAKKRKLYNILAEEQVKIYELNTKRININNEHLYKRTKIINKYNEEIQRINEKNVLRQIDNEFESVFSTNK